MVFISLYICLLCAKTTLQEFGTPVDTCLSANESNEKENDCEMSNTKERTFICIKPDAVQRGLIGNIIERFEQRGYKLVAMKMMKASKSHLEIHYQELQGKPFFKSLVDYMSSGPVVAMVWEGLDVVKQGRQMLGATNPLNSMPGTIRGDFSIQTGRNIVHGSDSLSSAEREIAHWFKPDELCEWNSATATWVYE
ncbi:Nucleoside diphosphate kinase B domain protein [Acanthocheilonema viteae]|uniref:Nucleoside diphosphate kinase n=1 Tax=Acanthocheilonema viteae TaxID=6277 RepID=A0A498SD88_ACAVI|nr:unnamed protein product [Acanthocheilonema viteae]